MTRSAGSEKSTSMPKPFAIEIVQHVEPKERAPIAEAIRHDVHRPAARRRMFTGARGR
jgi:hypothetical protein